MGMCRVGPCFLFFYCNYQSFLCEKMQKYVSQLAAYNQHTAGVLLSSTIPHGHITVDSRPGSSVAAATARLTATAGRCEYPYRKRCNLLVTVYHFLCQSFVVYAQDRLKKLEAAGLQGACSRVCREIRKDLDAQHKTMRQIRVHQRANIQGGRRLPYQHCLFE